MRLFAYYALHTFKNGIKKLFKTWVLIFLLVCIVLGGVIGVVAAMLSDGVEGDDPEASVPTETVEEPPEEDPLEAMGIEGNDLLELGAGGLALLMLVMLVIGADKNGSRIFQPADVNLLFASPMKPQSVLLFRLTTQLGTSAVASLYLLFQIPNLTLNLGLSLWAVLAVIAAWCFTICLATLLQVLLYVLSTAHHTVKRLLRPCIYGLLLLIAAGYLLYVRQSNAGWLVGAVEFFNSPISRYIPVWGWLKGFCMFAVEGNALGAWLSLGAILLCGAGLIYVIYHLRTDFYEDALAKSEEVAELMERAKAENSSGVLVKRSKDRSERLKRDGLRHGSGANVFFFKAMYNRFRFAHLNFFTKTMELYLVAGLGVALLAAETDSILPVALTLGGLSFFRALGNPLAQDTGMSYFVMIPEKHISKLFWSLMGGTANCLLDVLVPLVLGALIVGANPLLALPWALFIATVDLYATCVGTFIDLSVPVKTGKTVKQLVQVLFVYFGLLPDVIILAVGILMGYTVLALIGAMLCNILLGTLFFALCPLFLDHK